MNDLIKSTGGSLAPIAERGKEQAGRFVAINPNERHVVEILNGIFEDAVKRKASDIHINFHEYQGLRVRVRIEGLMERTAARLNASEQWIAKTKIMAKSKLDDTNRLEPQDGAMMVYFDGREVNLRVNICPTVEGFKLICRLLDSNGGNQHIDKLEMPLKVKQVIKKIVSSPEGMMIVSGPTGSGKTTTLYGVLGFLDTDDVHIMTLENPVEYIKENFTQININHNLTFSKALKAGMRMDPNIALIGEIRDEESAIAAQKMGTSGHLVLSTTHANSAPESITRLLAFGLQPFEITSVLSGVLAQRLVRKIDPTANVEWKPPTDIERLWLTKRHLYEPDMKLPHVMPAEGTTGWKGRLPLVELIEITPPIRRILETGDGDPITWIPRIVEEAVKQEQFETLAQAGLRAVLAGKTTLQEVISNTSDVAYIPKKRRWEQILIHQGKLKVEDAEIARGEIQKIADDEKRLVSYKHHLLNTGRISLQDFGNAATQAELEITDE